MSKKNVATNNATVNKTTITPFERKTNNTQNALKQLKGKLKNVQFLTGGNPQKMKAYDLCMAVLGPKKEIKIPDFQRAPYTFKMPFMDRLMSGVITGLKPEMANITIGILKSTKEQFILDGLQRCSASFLFYLNLAGFHVVINDQKIGDTLEIWYELPENKKKTGYQLDDEYKKLFDELEFNITYALCDTMEEMRDIFMVVNTSTTVSSAAKTNAYATDRIRAEVACIMETNKGIVNKYPVRNINGTNNGDAVMNQKIMFEDFLLMCLNPKDFTGQKQERYLRGLTEYRKTHNRVDIANTAMEAAVTLFNKCIKLMDKLCIDESKKNVTTYRVTFILVLNIIHNRHEKYFEEINVLSDLLKNMTVLPTTDGQCSNVRQMHEKEIDLYETYITPYVNRVNSELKEIYTFPEDDDKFVA